MVETISKPEIEMPVQHKISNQSESETTQIGTLTLSREFEEIVKALGDIQSSINTSGLTAESVNEVLNNPYASLPAILKALTPHLKSHGITLLQPYEANGSTICVTTIFIKGKQYASMSASMEADTPHPHSIGSVITYCCRYSIRAMLGLAVDGPGDQDDDGNRASGVVASESASSVPITATQSATAVKAKTSEKPDPTGYSEALRGYLKRVETADMAGLTSAEAQVPAFKLKKEEQEILLKAIRERKEKLVASSPDDA